MINEKLNAQPFLWKEALDAINRGQTILINLDGSRSLDSGPASMGFPHVYQKPEYSSGDSWFPGCSSATVDDCVKVKSYTLNAICHPCGGRVFIYVEEEVSDE